MDVAQRWRSRNWKRLGLILLLGSVALAARDSGRRAPVSDVVPMRCLDLGAARSRLLGLATFGPDVLTFEDNRLLVMPGSGASDVREVPLPGAGVQLQAAGDYLFVLAISGLPRLPDPPRMEILQQPAALLEYDAQYQLVNRLDLDTCPVSLSALPTAGGAEVWLAFWEDPRVRCVEFGRHGHSTDAVQVSLAPSSCVPLGRGRALVGGMSLTADGKVPEMGRSRAAVALVSRSDGELAVRETGTRGMCWFGPDSGADDRRLATLDRWSSGYCAAHIRAGKDTLTVERSRVVGWESNWLGEVPSRHWVLGLVKLIDGDGELAEENPLPDAPEDFGIGLTASLEGWQSAEREPYAKHTLGIWDDELSQTLGHIDFPIGRDHAFGALSPDGRRLYLLLSKTGPIATVDLATLADQLDR